MFRDLMGIRKRFQRLERRVRDSGLGVDGPPAGIVPLAEPELVAVAGGPARVSRSDGGGTAERDVIDLTDRGLPDRGTGERPLDRGDAPERRPALPATDPARF
jgi:hypothetical protein